MLDLSRASTAIGRQLRHPSGLGGRLLGGVMGIANRQSNAVAIRALQITPDETVLELGVGPGHAVTTLAAASPYRRVLGLDHSSATPAQAARRNRRAIVEGRVCLLQGRFDTLPCRTDSIDKILAVHVAYFFSARGAELREAQRVLRPGGRMAVFVTDKAAMERWRFPNHQLFDQVSSQDVNGEGQDSRCTRSPFRQSPCRSVFPACSQQPPKTDSWMRFKPTGC